MVDVFCGFLIAHDASHSLNVRAAYVYLIADGFTSVGVVLGGVLMHYYHLYWIDPLFTIFIGIYLLIMAWKLLKESTHIIMHFVPERIDLQDVRKYCLGFASVADVHHMHAWEITDGKVHFEAHLSLKNDMLLSK